MSDSVQYYVFLREPISRTVSNLRHFQRNYPENKRLDLQQIFEKYQTHLQNLQTRFLAISNKNELSAFFDPGTISQAHLEIAKKNLRKCAFIGITEKFRESIDLVETILNVRLGKQIKRNVAPIRKEAEVAPELRKMITDQMSLDIQLYQYALELFDEQQNRLSQTP